MERDEDRGAQVARQLSQYIRHDTDRTRGASDDDHVSLDHEGLRFAPGYPPTDAARSRFPALSAVAGAAIASGGRDS